LTVTIPGNGLPSFLAAQVGAAELLVTDGDATEVAMVKGSVDRGYLKTSGETSFRPLMLWWGAEEASRSSIADRKETLDVVMACEVLTLTLTLPYP